LNENDISLKGEIMEQTGWYTKYKIERMDGRPIDPNACYFVLRLDKDPVARKAMLVYASSTEDAQLGADIMQVLNDLDPELMQEYFNKLYKS
jgi:hypothetical protein